MTRFTTSIPPDRPTGPQPTRRTRSNPPTLAVHPPSTRLTRAGQRQDAPAPYGSRDDCPDSPAPGRAAVTTCFLVASTPADVLTMAAAVRSGALDPSARRVLVVGPGSASDALQSLVDQLALAGEVVTLKELLASPGTAGVELVVGTASLEVGRALARQLV